MFLIESFFEAKPLKHKVAIVESVDDIADAIINITKAFAVEFGREIPEEQGEKVRELVKKYIGRGLFTRKHNEPRDPEDCEEDDFLTKLEEALDNGWWCWWIISQYDSGEAYELMVVKNREVMFD